MNEAASTPTGRPVPNGAVQDDAVRDGAVRDGAAQDGPGDQEAAEGAPQHSPALEVRGLTKSFGDTVAVAGLDLCMARGSVLALLGPNGAGKTTTVEICEGFQ
ncbi:ATP-binding cassette domain-containing protein, partial [Saccharopolyspora sp.]|uniref:ATP-binding cassette domain-containing protein n=1 Tax=Saccharopolyspora sp. TaxID=33915 RepID=UPI0025DE5D52